MGRGIPIGIGLGSPDVRGYFRDAPDAGSSDILKNRKTRKLLFIRERFSHKIVLYRNKTTNRKDGNDRKDHEKISCFHQNLTL